MYNFKIGDKVKINTSWLKGEGIILSTPTEGIGRLFYHVSVKDNDSAFIKGTTHLFYYEELTLYNPCEDILQGILDA